MSGQGHITECGLPGIGAVPYGVHLCHFYASREDLVEALVPYFEAGLRKNERCIWVTAAPLQVAEAKAALAKVFPGLDDAIAQERIRILDFEDWYMRARDLKGNEVVGIWLKEEEAALAAGFAGLRITGNTSFLTPENWDAFMQYEHLVSEAFTNRRIVTLCSYALKHSGAAETLDVARSHHCTIACDDSRWRVLGSGFQTDA